MYIPGAFFGKAVELIEAARNRAKTIWYKLGTKLVRIELAWPDVLADKGKKNSGARGLQVKVEFRKETGGRYAAGQMTVRIFFKRT